MHNKIIAVRFSLFPTQKPELPSALWSLSAACLLGFSFQRTHCSLLFGHYPVVWINGFKYFGLWRLRHVIQTFELSEFGFWFVQDCKVSLIPVARKASTQNITQHYVSKAWKVSHFGMPPVLSSITITWSVGSCWGWSHCPGIEEMLRGPPIRQALKHHLCGVPNRMGFMSLFFFWHANVIDLDSLEHKLTSHFLWNT